MNDHDDSPLATKLRAGARQPTPPLDAAASILKGVAARRRRRLITLTGSSLLAIAFVVGGLYTVLDDGSTDSVPTAAVPSPVDNTLDCPWLTSMDIDYVSGDGGYATPELAARSMAEPGDVVRITSRADHEATFTIETANGEAHTIGTVFVIEGRWLIEHLSTCDPRRP